MEEQIMQSDKESSLLVRLYKVHNAAQYVKIFMAELWKAFHLKTAFPTGQDRQKWQRTSKIANLKLKSEKTPYHEILAFRHRSLD